MNQDSRRGFLGTVARWGAVIGLGALVARLAGRTPSESEETGSRDVCRRCRVLDACNRPEGLRARDALGRAPVRATHAPDAKGLCGEPPDGQLVSRWVRREDA